MLTREQILAMVPGSEMDRIIMEKIFNASKNYYGEEEYWYHYDENGEPDYEWSCYHSPSTDTSAAWEVVEKMSRGKTDCSFILEFHFERYYATFGEVPIYRKNREMFATAPEAICKAALISTLEV